MVEIIYGKVSEINGYGDGSGGYGYGDGDGSGYGDGPGDGDGSGYGDGDGPYWRACLDYFVAKMPEATRTRVDALKALNIPLAYWRSDVNGAPANGGQGVTATPGVHHIESGPLNLCSAGTLHATLLPTRWKGERWWIVALHGEVVGDDEKFGCLDREVIGECL